MTNFLFTNKVTGKIDNLSLDVVVRENHLFQNEVPEFEIEDGSAVNDFIIKKPDRVTIEGLITNTPMIGNVGDGVSSYAESFKSSNLGQQLLSTGKRTEVAFKELMRIIGRAYPISPGGAYKLVPVGIVTIVTGLRVYSDMAATQLSIQRDAGTGDALQFTMDFCAIKKVAFLKSQIDAPIKDTKNLKTSVPAKKNVGKVTAVTTKPRVSFLAGMFNRLATGR
jgi:hypothetical protein